MTSIITLSYLVSSVLFILGLKQLSSPKTARSGNMLATAAMFIAVVVTLFDRKILGFAFIIAGILIGSAIGVFIARKARMTSMPQTVALFNGLGGGASAFVALTEYYHATGAIPPGNIIALVMGLFIGAVTFSGSFVACMKLQGMLKAAPVVFKMQHLLSAGVFFSCIVLGTLVIWNPGSDTMLLVLFAAVSLVGVLFVIPIGGADMPVVISFLNACSGLAAAATGFAVSNTVLIVSGALVGASGTILTLIMCKAMNRSLRNVMFGAVGNESSVYTDEGGGRRVAEYDPEDAVAMLESAQSVIIVPGYGLAVARAQHTLQELVKVLMDRGIQVRYAIHPVAGRMPGHMNVLLAEADVSYDLLLDLDAINDDFQNTDVVLVVGANDVINPAARTDKSCPLYGMPILNVDGARTVIICKRGLGHGFSGVDNELFYDQKTMMIFGDAKETLNQMVKLIKE
ncbi:MAG: NAD(P)(+) transhydrogenase (Re/Si-specific) subunit beta [Candidatus Brocadiaceae bacterium]|nr:NAD(P)(+) transhydrogenase (Re/Si-specific) subunit beta [Candidatus Brocadiaceae bacterium]